MARFDFYFLTENHESQIIIYQYLTAMVSGISIFHRNGLLIDQSLSYSHGLVADQSFNSHGLVADQSLTAMAHRLEFNSNCKTWIIILARDWLIRSYIYRWAGSGIGS